MIASMAYVIAPPTDASQVRSYLASGRRFGRRLWLEVRQWFSYSARWDVALLVDPTGDFHRRFFVM